MGSYLTIADLFAIWKSSVDSLYADPIVDAGDGGGLEVYNQAFAQYERVSIAIDRTMQGMFVLPHSSQSDSPSKGDNQALVVLTLSRESSFHIPIVFVAGSMVEEQTTDHGVDEGIDILTGRRYSMLNNVCFLPGEVGPIDVYCLAEYPGYSYNNPEVGSIRSFVQPGATKTNNQATVVANNGGDTLYAYPETDTFFPSMVGLYVSFEAGSNIGKIRRIVGYSEPALVPIEHGGAVLLAQDLEVRVGAALSYVDGEVVVDSVTGGKGVLLRYDSTTGQCVIQSQSGFFALGSNLVGDTSAVANAITEISMFGMLVALGVPSTTPMWTVGETVTQAITGATGTFLYLEGSVAVINPISGSFDSANPVVGTLSAVSITPTFSGVEPALLSETGTAEWRILGWDDLGFGATNSESPIGGSLGVLDELGRERNIPRADGESDTSYRKRISSLPDLVTPNAIRRACARFFTPLGLSYEFREVGTTDFPGFFFDVPSQYAPTHSFAFDMIRIADRFKVLLDYSEFRAFFLVGVPQTGYGESGFGYDSTPYGFYDIKPFSDFYDGYAWTEGSINAGLWNDLTNRKAAGVGFDFYYV